jgi:hypothetical protein
MPEPPSLSQRLGSGAVQPPTKGGMRVTRDA